MEIYKHVRGGRLRHPVVQDAQGVRVLNTLIMEIFFVSNVDYYRGITIYVL